jgi:hypothetical protein
MVLHLHRFPRHHHEASPHFHRGNPMRMRNPVQVHDDDQDEDEE